ncbi:SufD family Fe-S cluster assembly protein [Arcobacteraceae bacterium]|nr:SufD family Fe-S cluster assembly protein [Arcobacteraceae bacterium]
MKKYEPYNNINKVENLVNTYKFLNNDTTSYEVEENETLTIIDVIDADSESSFQRELKVNDNATLNYIKIGKSKTSSNIKYTNSIGENATLNISYFDVESSINSVETKLKSKSSSLNINGLIDLQDNAKVQYDIVTNHQNESLSDIKFKNLLDGKSSAKLRMFSIVEETASFSKAFQNSQTILLSDDSFIAVTPHLEILIDELEASHGATCGDLDQDSIYYLKSRGIKEEDAKVILLNALRNEVYESFENDELSEIIKGLV